jgi:hypothetical protein
LGVPLLFTEEFEVVIMIRCCGSKRRMGRIETSDLKPITSEPMVGKAKPFNESEMALFSECWERCGEKKGLTAPALLETPVNVS